MNNDNNKWLSFDLGGSETFCFRPVTKSEEGVITEYFPSTEQGTRLECKDCAGQTMMVEMTREAERMNVLVHGDVSEQEWTGILVQSGEKDHYLGFGEKFETYDLKGIEVDLWVTNGAFGRYSYKPIPFFMNPRGYGLTINSDRRSICRLQCPDQRKATTLMTEDGEFSFSLIIKDDLKEILMSYMETMGLPDLPAEWVFGPWKSRDWQLENQESVGEDFRKQRDLGIAATVKLIDASWQSSYITFDFHKERFPFPQEMLAEAKRLGYKMVLWVAPWMSLESDRYWEMHERGFLVKDKEGNPYVTRLGNDPGFRGSCFDFTNPEFIEYWQGQISKLMDMGAAGFKTDFGEQIDEDAVFFNGKTGKEMHNIFPYIYNKATWDVAKERGGYLLGRSAWRYSQSIPGVWAGDQTGDFCRWSGLPSAITAGISAGMSGLGFWASDIGGYFSSPDKETLLRWTEFGTFSPVMQLHGMGEHDPWNYDEETLDTYRKYSELRMRLLPHIYAAAKVASDTGLSMMRALPLEYPKDSAMYEDVSNQYEYFFGNGLLCAPICFGGTGRQVYLPESSWCDWWSGEVFEGSKSYRMEAELTKIPLFLKEDSIIPTYDAAMMTTEPIEEKDQTRPDLVFEIYPKCTGEAKTTDGVSAAYRLNDGKLNIVLNGLDRGRKIGLKLRGQCSGIQCEDCNVVEVGMQKSLPAMLLGGDFEMQRIDVRIAEDGSCRLVMEYKE